MKIALSGASGSIGTLLKKYLAKKHKISTTSFRKESEHIKKLDLRNDVFIHLASLNANLISENDRLLELDIAKRAFKYCKKNKIGSLIFFSTSQVYGTRSINDEPFKETDPSPCTSIYSIAKLDCEVYLTQECKKNNINLIILRSCPFIDLESNSKIALLGKLAKNFKLSIEFSKASTNIRSFLTKKNLFLIIDGVLNLIENSNSPIFEILNIGDKNLISTNEIVNVISKAHSVKPLRVGVPKIFEIIASKMPIINNLYRNLTSNHAVDINRAEKILGIKILHTKQSI